MPAKRYRQSLGVGGAAKKLNRREDYPTYFEVVEVLASLRFTTADEIERIMTLDQIQLRYYFYLRERGRDSERLATAVGNVVAQLFGG